MKKTILISEVKVLVPNLSYIEFQVQIDRHGNKLLKLGDFGLAQVVTEPLYTVCGTPTYVAPEILAEAGYGLKVSPIHIEKYSFHALF